MNSYNNPHLGSNHAAELDAFFSTPAAANAMDQALFQSMREYWTSFVTTGRPVSSNGVEWGVRFLFLPNFLTYKALKSFIWSL